jgi:hypothetical protein
VHRIAASSPIGYDVTCKVTQGRKNYFDNLEYSKLYYTIWCDTRVLLLIKCVLYQIHLQAWFDSWQGQNIFFVSKSSKPSQFSHPFSYSLRRVKQAGRKADHPPPSSANFKNNVYNGDKMFSVGYKLKF